MKDRIPTSPNRYQLAHADGTSEYVTLTRADNPTQVGTPLTKATLLTDTTADAIGLEQSDPTVDDALAALNGKIPTSVLTVTTDAGTIVTATLGDTTLTATADSTGTAVLYPAGFGTWEITVEYNGRTYSKDFEITALAEYSMRLRVVPALSEATPAEIQEVTQAGDAPLYWAVGDYTAQTISYGSVNWSAVLIGFDHNLPRESGGNNISHSTHFQLFVALKNPGKFLAAVDENTYQTNTSSSRQYYFGDKNSDGYINYNGSNMYTLCNTTIYNSISADWRSVIATCTKYAALMGTGGTGVYANYPRIWPLSEYEVFGATTYSYSGEASYQKQYDYYKNGNTKIAYPWAGKTAFMGTALRHWLRSRHATSSMYICCVSADGQASYDDGTYDLSVCPGFMVA
jgi:hypothetical protein